MSDSLDPFGFGGTPQTVPPGWRVPMLSGAQPIQSLQQQNAAAAAPVHPQAQGLNPATIQAALGLGPAGDQLGLAEQHSKEAGEYKPRAGSDYGSEKGGFLRAIGDTINDMGHAVKKKAIDDDVAKQLQALNAQQDVAYRKYMNDLQASQGIGQQQAPQGAPPQTGGAFSF